MTLMTGGTYYGRIVVEMPMMVGERGKRCEGAKGGEEVVRKVADYVKDGNGWRWIGMKEVVHGGGRGTGGARVGKSEGMDREVSRWTRPVAVVFGSCEEHGVIVEVVVKELN